MQRSAWIFLAAILLPSLGLAWLAVHSVRDQQVVLLHQEAIISQNITDTLAKNVQSQMDQLRSDFVTTTQNLINGSPSPQVLAQNYNRRLRDAWPLAEIGFAVNLNGEIYSPKPYEGPDEKIFRDENDRFLSNRENVEVYSSNNAFAIVQNSSQAQNAVTDNSLKKQDILTRAGADLLQNKEAPINAPGGQTKQKSVDLLEAAKDQGAALDKSEAAGAVTRSSLDGLDSAKAETGVMGKIIQNQAADEKTKSTPATVSGGEVDAATARPSAGVQRALSDTDSLNVAQASPAPAAALSSVADAETPSSDMQTAATSAPVSAAPSDSPSSSSMYRNEAINAIQQIVKIPRKVIPQQNLAQQETAALSNTLPEESDFRRVIGTDSNGTLARFLENKLRLIVWDHASTDAPIVFGAQLNQDKLVESLKPTIQIPEADRSSYSRSSSNNYCLAILDDSGHPVVLSRPEFKGDWKHPFVATEIGEALPHWEAALYLVDPEQINHAARTLQLTLGLIVLLLVASIMSGGSLIAADVRRQVRMAQQKTDFVSNVSHELKTPLTSIRMFAELLAEKRVPDEERQTTYLRIIAAEAARLTRLINNVLDFARLERGAPPGEHRACDLVDAVRDVIGTCQPHLEASGITFREEIEADTLPITGDRDALAQIILNLVSNAEKYGGNDVMVRVRRQETTTGTLGCVDVLDRGPGIPPKEAKTIFEAFHRLDDSLSSGIPGSGLGLTLARRMARSHGGDVTCSPRAGGGSCFTLSVPLALQK